MFCFRLVRDHFLLVIKTSEERWKSWKYFTLEPISDLACDIALSQIFSWAFSTFCSQATKFREKKRQRTCDSQSLFISAMICYWPFKVGCSLTPKQMTITQELERRHQWSCLKNMIQTLFSHDCWSLLFGAEYDGADPNSFIPPACPVIWYCHTQWNIQLIASWWFIAKTRILTECFIVTLWQLEMAIQRNSVGKSKVMENLDFVWEGIIRIKHLG